MFWTGELTAKMSWRRSPKRARGCLGRGSGSGLILYHRFPTIKPVNIRLLFLGTRKARRFDRIYFSVEQKNFPSPIKSFPALPARCFARTQNSRGRAGRTQSGSAWPTQTKRLPHTDAGQNSCLKRIHRIPACETVSQCHCEGAKRLKQSHQQMNTQDCHDA